MKHNSDTAVTVYVMYIQNKPSNKTKKLQKSIENKTEEMFPHFSMKKSRTFQNASPLIVKMINKNCFEKSYAFSNQTNKSSYYLIKYYFFILHASPKYLTLRNSLQTANTEENYSILEYLISHSHSFPFEPQESSSSSSRFCSNIS